MTYSTIRRSSSIELIVNKSRFIGQCFPVDTEERALCLLDDVRKRYRDASHNCFAYSLGREGGPARFSDDGEPQGTAGLPMMETVKNKGVTDLLVVVTRYFGGVLLGAGGLVRAYTKAASAAIDAAEPVLMRRCAEYSIDMDYSMFSLLEPILKKLGKVRSLEYTDRVKCEITVPETHADDFIIALTQRTDGKVRPERTGTAFDDFSVDIGVLN